MESSSSLEKRSQSETKAVFGSSEVDIAAQLTAGKEFVVDPAEAARVRYASLQCAFQISPLNINERATDERSTCI